MRSTSPSSWLCKTTMTSVLFLLTLLWLPHPGSAQRPRLQPTACIETGSELLNAIRDYYGYGLSEEFEYDSPAAQTYGWPIDSWCVSNDVEEKLSMREESPLNEHVSAAVHNMIAVHDDDASSTLDTNDLISDWSWSFTGKTCLDLCSDLNDVPSFSTTTNSFSSNEENVKNYDTEGGEEKDQALLGDSASDSYEDAINNTENQESPQSSSQSSGSRNKTTTGMLFRLIPVKLVVVLSLMCLVLGVRQIFLSAEGHNGYCCCCKLGCSLFGFGSGGYATYEGIDPSDVSDHQKSVEFELLQLGASGDVDGDVEADVVIS
jgi:hypothetical protein